MSQSFLGEVIRHRSESNRLTIKSKYGSQLYKGYEISLSSLQHTLGSNIPQLNNLKMRYVGANVGVMLANNFVKVKATTGYYESEPSVPYDMNMIQLTLSGSIYPLRLIRMRSHFIEPYVLTGLTHQLTWFHGDYLPNFDQAKTQTNYSSATESLLGRTDVTQLNVGLGLEYQLISHKIIFIHLFTEVSYGIPFLSTASNAIFSGTHPNQPTMFSIGINFGMVK